MSKTFLSLIVIAFGLSGNAYAKQLFMRTLPNDMAHPFFGSPDPSDDQDINYFRRETQAENLPADAPTGKGVTVAILLTGFDLNHPELQGSFAINEKDPVDGIDNDGNGKVDDNVSWNFVDNNGDVNSESSSLNLATIMALFVGAHGRQMLGMAPGAKILPIQVLDENGNGDYDTVIQGIDYAVERGAKIIVIGFGGGDSDEFTEKVAELEKKGVMLVAPTNYSGEDTAKDPSFPSNLTASFSNVISVALTQRGSKPERLASQSGYGDLVDLAAPGDYARLGGGTAFSAAVVGGALALAFEKFQTFSPAEMKAKLLSTVDQLGMPVKSKGRLNVTRLLDITNN